MLYVGLLYIVPGLLAAILYCNMKKIEYKSIDFILYILIFIFLINSFIIGMGYLRGHGINPVESLHCNIGTTAKYSALSLLLSVTLPHILLVATKFVRGKTHE